jgi:hypothetical protein
MRILFCGSRDLSSSWVIWGVLHKIKQDYGLKTVILHGGATGADAHAAYYADKLGFEVECFDTDWDHCDESCYHKPRTREDGAPYCPAAGPRRNREMLASGVDLVFAFTNKSLKDSKGTLDMVTIAEKAGVPTFVNPTPAQVPENTN